MGICFLLQSKWPHHSAFDRIAQKNPTEEQPLLSCHTAEVYASPWPSLLQYMKSLTIRINTTAFTAYRCYFSVSVQENEAQKDHNHMLAVTCSFFLNCRVVPKFTLIKMSLSDSSLNSYKTFILINTRKICQCLLTAGSKQLYQLLIFMHSNFSIMKRLFPLILHTALYYAQEKAYVNIISILPFLFILLLIRT